MTSHSLLSSFRTSKATMKFTSALAAFFLCVCGFKLTWGKSFTDYHKRIINGEKARPEDYPWQALISGSDPDEPCSGSIVGDKWILSAASCVSGADPEELTVTLGMTERSKRNGKDHKVKRVFSHNDYNDDNLDSDMALLELKTKISENSVTKAIELPKQGDMVTVGTKCSFVGWGTTKADDLVWPQFLQKAEVPIISHDACKTLYSEMMNVNQQTMVCAGGNGKGGCQGDSGGSLACKEGGKWVLRGLGSWGSEDCDPSKYNVLTRVSTFVKWIKDIVD